MTVSKEPPNARRVRHLIELEEIRLIILRRPCLATEEEFQGLRVCGRCGYSRTWKPSMKRYTHCDIPF